MDASTILPEAFGPLPQGFSCKPLFFYFVEIDEEGGCQGLGELERLGYEPHVVDSSKFAQVVPSYLVLPETVLAESGA